MIDPKTQDECQTTAELLVLGQARSTTQIAIELLKVAQRGALEGVVLVMRDTEGRLSATWDDTHDTPALCEAATYLRLESERCVLEEHSEDTPEDEDEGGDHVEGDTPRGGGGVDAGAGEPDPTGGDSEA